MTDGKERREPSAQRVTVSTLVEVCGNAPGTPVFEAESIDVSPRGMHLRTAYLPEEGTPLVCRFENEGGEIVVEGVVAWRRESGRGGEFGVRFTALESRGVDALRSLCGANGQRGGGYKPAERPIGETGARVRLHIDGLGSPMKARVRSGNVDKVQVGSNLEFLKVGRKLELEDLELGARRSAWIDGVSVLVDPSTQIPQLVVALRYESAEDHTPSPTVAPAVRKEALPTKSDSEREPKVLRIPRDSVTTSSAPSPTSDAAPHEDDANEEEEPALRGRVASFAANAEGHAKAASEKLASASGTAARGAARWLKGAFAYATELGKKRPAAPPRRVTAPPPVNAVSSDKPKLRAQNGAVADEPPPKRRLSRKAGIALGAASVLGALSAGFLFHSKAAPPPGVSAGAASSAMVTVDAALPLQDAQNGAITAHVPLFGPTPLTTTESAPLGPPPIGSVEQLELAEAKSAARSSAEEDDEFPEASPRRAERNGRADDKVHGAERDESDLGSPASPGSKVSPEDVPAWGRGRMNLPTIHRLRLDGPGAAIQGTAEPTGFTILIPNRKAMEPAAGIASRDSRLARVRATNVAGGAQVSFRFKDSVPGYRVRLRRDYIEFLISAEEKGTKSKAAKKTAR